MSRTHLVRFGVMGHVGPFVAVDAARYPRQQRVIVRTARGLEVGEVVAPPEGLLEEPPRPTRVTTNGNLTGPPPAGALLRQMTVEDELLSARLEQNRNEAFEACAEHLKKQRVPATLIDIEQLFDGRRLFFYFLGEVPPEIEGSLNTLARRYDAVANVRQFAETLASGCGPGCGLASPGGSCDACNGCTLASACNQM